MAQQPRLILAVALLAMFATPALAAPAYILSKSTPLGTPDRWDYVVFSRDTGRVYVAHGDKVAVIDAKSGDLVGEVEGIAGGTHGSAISAATGQGFTDDGRNGLAIVYDLKTLKITRQISAAKDADAIAIDRASGHLFVIEGNSASITVIDPKTDAVVGTVRVGEKMEVRCGRRKRCGLRRRRGEARSVEGRYQNQHRRGALAYSRLRQPTRPRA